MSHTSEIEFDQGSISRSRSGISSSSSDEEVSDTSSISGIDEDVILRALDSDSDIQYDLDENSEELIERCRNLSPLISMRDIKRGNISIPPRREFRYFGWDFDNSTEFLYRMPTKFRREVMKKRVNNRAKQQINKYPGFVQCAFLLHEVSCTNLAPKDDMTSSSDPFLEVTTDSIRADQFYWKSEKRLQNLNPHWQFHTPKKMGPLIMWDVYQIRIMDWDQFSAADFMGVIRFTPGVIYALQELSGKNTVTIEFQELSHCTSLFYIPPNADSFAATSDDRFKFSENVTGTLKMTCSIEILEEDSFMIH